MTAEIKSLIAERVATEFAMDAARARRDGNAITALHADLRVIGDNLSALGWNK